MGATHAHDHLGTEPRNARSPLRLRLILATIACVTSVVGAVLLAGASFAAESGDDATALRVSSSICAVVAVIALIDLLVVRRRIRNGDTG